MPRERAAGTAGPFRLARAVRPARGAAVALAGVAIMAFSGGCQLPDSSLLDVHMKDDQRAAAKGRWDAVRGSVKLQLAEEHFKSERLDEAEKSLKEAMALAPHDSQAQVLLARIRLEQGRLGEAREAIDLATMMRPDDAQAQFLAGMVAQRYGELPTAYEHYTNAANIAPHESSYLLAQAEVLVALDKPTDALELIEPRLADFDRDVSLRLLAGRITRLLGLRDPCIAYGREAVRLSDNDPAIATELGLTLVWAGRLAEAVDVLAPIVERAKRVEIVRDEDVDAKRRNKKKDATVAPSTVHALARAYMMTDLNAEAMKVLGRAMHDCPEDPIAWRLYAHAAVSTGDLERASEALQVLRGRAAMTAETWLLAGYVALRRGDVPGARDAARKAVALEDSLAEAHFLLGEASEALGQVSAARMAYENALSRDPELTVAERRLAALSMGASVRGTESNTWCDDRMGDVEP